VNLFSVNKVHRDYYRVGFAFFVKNGDCHNIINLSKRRSRLSWFTCAF
jgi:hypothetical protein